MYTSYYNRNTNKKDELKKLESQTREGNAAYDKGEAMLTGEEKQGKSPTPPLRQDNTSGVGSIIKDSLNYILQKKYPDNRYTGVFDGIDDAEIENNLPLADEVIAKNSANPYNKDLFSNLPNLRGGLATFYTAAFSGNYEAANVARNLAYTESGNAEPTAETVANNKRYVNADIGLNVRSKAGTDTPIIGKLKKGTEVEFTGKKTGVRR